MFSYQGSLFFAVCSSDSFNRLSHRFLFVNNFFQVLSFSLDVCRRMIQDHLFCTPLYLRFPERNIPFVSQRQPSPGLQIFLCFVPVPSATKTILPPLPVIVNVFLVFCLFHAIQTIRCFSDFKRNNCHIFLLFPSSFFILRKRNSLSL